MKKIVPIVLIFAFCLTILTINVVAKAEEKVDVRLEVISIPNPYGEPFEECYGVIRASKQGNIIWEHRTENSFIGEHNGISDVYINNKTVYIIVNKILYAIDINSGNTKWTANGMSTNSFMVFDKYGNIYVGCPMHTFDVAVVDPNGKKLYEYDSEYSLVNKLEINKDMLLIKYAAPVGGFNYLDISKFKPITVEIDGREISFDQFPIISNGRTLVPVRAVTEEMGGKVDWDPSSKTATLSLGDNTIELTIGSSTAYLNGKPQSLDTTPQIVNGRTMLPIRFVAESFDYDVSWNGDLKLVDIRKKSLSSFGYELLDCLGKTKKEIVQKYGPITDSSYWLGGKYYIHGNMKTEMFYENDDDIYNYEVHDDAPENAKCVSMYVNINELISTSDKIFYSIKDLESIFGACKFENYLDDEFYPMCCYRFYFGDYVIYIESDKINPTLEYFYVSEK